ncbi:glycosyltransferase family 2 protein [Adhaeretor mobilis]|uniref:Undecaprenyl-phosphate mannosyltransferase n=1 Tax=Adhaeretor mobilis TaxID=1930276 RepID=A0A517MUE0_9BACT|nr:glycosyltransferase family 2 protein [Adhaeretor mobilis]QDS98407.1 Undecaprenyl-phosphate mannosyltransferase [Adhaeretor mobilis]
MATPDYSDTIVVIPALNEDQSLPKVLADLPPVGCVIVADNGSTDATASKARAAGAIVVREPRRGYGSACLAGLAKLEELIVSGQLPTPKVVAFIDADYSDHPEEMPRLVEPILDGEAEIVIGSRILGKREQGALPPQSRYGNTLACFLMRVLFGIRYTDLGPFRAIQYQALRDLNMCDVGFGWTIEMQIKAAQATLAYLEVPVSYRCRIGQSKITGTLRGCVSAGAKILYTIAKYAVRRDSPASGRSAEVPREVVSPAMDVADRAL